MMSPGSGWRGLAISQILPDSLEERVPQFALGRLGAVFDLGAELRLDPDRLVCDLPGVGLALADQRF